MNLMSQFCHDLSTKLLLNFHFQKESLLYRGPFFRKSGLVIDLASAELFRDLDPSELQALREAARELTFPAGIRIFSENEPGDGVYVIREGLVEIAHLVGDRTLCVFSKFGPGEFFGEMAVIDDLPRSASTTAVKETKVYFIPRAEMAALLKRLPALSFKMLEEISRRLRDFNQHHLREVIQAERLSALGTFARSIVHDLKTPLTVINIATEIMSDPKTSTDMRRQSYARVRRQVNSITELVSDILDFTQSSRSGEPLPLLDYGDFIQTLVDELRSEVETKTSRLDLPEDPPDVKLQFDPHRLRRVLLNLIHNAVDMMPPDGRVVLHFHNDGNKIITEVQDSGPGIAPEVADKLFEAFVTFGKTHGTGLGLSICKKIIEDHGGQISARNAPVHGAIFSFTLPIPKT
jgi:signal transduction histidine kinase